MTNTRYFLLNDETNDSSQLGKVVEDETGIWGFLLVNGDWIEEPTITECLVDPLYGQELAELEAREMARRQGGKL